MNNKKLYLFAFVWVFLLAAPASASIEWISGAVCPNDCRKLFLVMFHSQGCKRELGLRGWS
jgi:hypothetical protein